MKRMLVIMILACLALAGTAQAAVWDLAADWSDTQNSNGVWQYGQVVNSAGTIIYPSVGNQTPDHISLFTMNPNFSVSGEAPHPAWSSPVNWWNCLYKVTSQGSWQGGPMDDPIGSIVGHTDNGFSWTAPYECTVNITGGGWMARSNSGVAVNMFVKGTKVINWVTLPGAMGDFMQTEWLSSNPYTWSRMISDPGGDPTVLNNVHFNAGEKIYVQGGGSDLWGMTFTVTEVVPEPSALCALSAGLVGLLGMIRRKR